MASVEAGSEDAWNDASEKRSDDESAVEDSENGEKDAETVDEKVEGHMGIVDAAHSEVWYADIMRSLDVR